MSQENLPKQRSESGFNEFKPPYGTGTALTEANRCLYCEDAPCTAACPTHIDIPSFIRKIATTNTWGASRTIFESNILGMGCARVCPVEVLCVGECVLNTAGQPPIQIGKLQRYATDAAYSEGWRFFEAGSDSGKRVALIGAGPASLAAAHELRRRGHACTIYEKRALVGGLSATGIAPYKMKADRAVQEAAWVLEIGGVAVETGRALGEDLDFAEVERAHDAVFIGFGLGQDRLAPDPGALSGVMGAVAFIEQMKTGSVADRLDGVTEALVVGGGNTAVDAVRELLGLGVPSVQMVYRGDEGGMSGYAHEWRVAKVDGARGCWRTLPVAFEGDLAVSGVTVVDVDSSKTPIPNTERSLPAQLVLMAIGQGKLGRLLGGIDGIEVQGGRVVVDSTQATGRPGVYAGGDCVNGGKEVVNAVAEGKAAAIAIDAYLGGEG